MALFGKSRDICLFHTINDELLKDHKIKLKETEALFRVSGGDARKLLNTLELAINNLPNKKTPPDFSTGAFLPIPDS